MNPMNELADRYIAVWNEADDAQRRALVEQTYTERATYVDPMMRGEGFAGINAMVGTARAQFPGHAFRRSSEVESHNGYVRFSWELSAAGSSLVARGTDIGVLEGNRFQQIIGFLDATPSPEQAGSLA
jgi:SnoaL-like domain